MRSYLCPQALLVGVLVATALPSWSAPEALLRGRDITACAYGGDGAAIYFSWARNSGEIRRFVPGQVTGGEPVAGDAAELVTKGISPRPFSDQLLFVRRGNQGGGLWVRDLRTQAERQMRRDPFLGLPPAISGDGSVVMVSRWAGRSKRIGAVDSATGKYSSLPGQDMSQPALNAGGDRLLFVRAGQVWLRDLRSGDDAQVTQGELAYSWPAWSPAGDRVALVAQAKEGACKVGVTGAAGGSPVWVTEALEGASCPSFSPDGRALIFLCRTADGHDTLICRVAVEATAEAGGSR